MVILSRRLLLLPVLIALVAPAVLPTGASNHPVNWLQPGDIATIGGTQCTLDFVFDGSGSLAGKVYIGIAGHCVNVGQPVNSNGYTNFGTVVMEDAIRDFALIEVKSTVVAHVKGEVKGHPGTPTGFTTSGETNQGDILQFSGFGLGFGLTQPTQENRVGILVSDNNTFYCGEGPVIFGDSGGPVVHMATGKALGIVNEISPPCSVLGFTIEGIISHAATLGFPITLRTA